MNNPIHSRTYVYKTKSTHSPASALTHLNCGRFGFASPERPFACVNSHKYFYAPNIQYVRACESLLVMSSLRFSPTQRIDPPQTGQHIIECS